MRAVGRTSLFLFLTVLFGQVMAESHNLTWKDISELNQTALDSLGPDKPVCYGQYGFDSEPFVGFATLEDGDSVCKYREIRDDPKSSLRSNINDFKWLPVARNELMQWLDDKENVSKATDGKTNTAFWAFSLGHFAGNEELDDRKPGAVELCVAYTSERAMSVGYLQSLEGGLYACIASTGAEYTYKEQQSKFPPEDYVETKKKAWCAKQRVMATCTATKTHNNIPQIQCGEEAAAKDVPFCVDPGNACCLVTKGLKLNTGDTGDGTNTCYIPESANEEDFHGKCGLSEGIKEFVQKASDGLADSEDSVKDELGRMADRFDW